MQGEGGFPPFLSHPKCELGFHAKFHDPRTTPSGRKVCDPEKKNNPKNSGQGQRKHFTRSKITFSCNYKEAVLCYRSCAWTKYKIFHVVLV